MLKIYIYWHKCWCNGCGTDGTGQVKIGLLSFWSVNRWVSQFHAAHLTKLFVCMSLLILKSISSLNGHLCGSSVRRSFLLLSWLNNMVQDSTIDYYGLFSGKSFLLSALCDPSFQQDSYIVPTVGVNIFSLNIDSRTCTTIRLRQHFSTLL